MLGRCRTEMQVSRSSPRDVSSYSLSLSLRYSVTLVIHISRRLSLTRVRRGMDKAFGETFHARLRFSSTITATRVTCEGLDRL